MKYESINEEVRVERIFPSVRRGELAKSINEVLTNRYIIQLFDGNQVTLYDLNDSETKPIEFDLPFNTQLT